MKEINRVIQVIKRKTQSIKDKRRNLKYKFNILHGYCEPECSYGCAYFAYLMSLDKHDLMYTENAKLLDEIQILNEDLSKIGKVILFLRGDRWSF